MTMKMTKKKLLVIALCVALAAIISLGSLAWFTAEDSVTNKFFVATSDDTDPSDVFGIDLWETVDDENGDPEVVGKGTEDDTHDFEEILPGQELTKEPVFENTGIHPMFVRATVTLTGMNVFRDVISNWYAPDALVDIQAAWVFDNTTFDPNANDGTLVHTFYYPTALDAKTVTAPIFTEVSIPEALTLAQAQALEKFDIVILGEAIQSEHLGVNTAKEAFETIYDPSYNNAYRSETLPQDAYVAVKFDGTNTVVLAQDESAQLIGCEGGPALKFEQGVTNAVVVLEGGNFTLADGEYIIEATEETPYTSWVFVSAPVTVNGNLYDTAAEWAEFKTFFKGINVSYNFAFAE